MSSLFNYELDENNIRSTLQNARYSAFSEASWNEFEDNFSKKLSKPSKATFIKFPDIQLNINRNVILPVAFILALVGVSAIMLSLIDFKPGAEKNVERKLEPNADNFKLKVSVSTPVIEVKKKEVQNLKPVETSRKADSVLVGNSVAVIVNTLTSNTHVVNMSDVNSVSQTTIKNTESINQSIATPTIQNVYYRQRRKKVEKVPETQMETIKAPALIKEETETTEPELEIKID